MAIIIEELKKVFTGPDGSVVPVIDIPCFRLEAGAHVALIGTSGSGKTTLLHLIAGILAPDSGRILFDAAPLAWASDSPPQALDPRLALDIAALSEADRDVFRGQNIGYIFQTHHLLGGFTALENVLLGMSFTGRPPDRPWARHLLAQVGLEARLDFRPQKLSLGQQQRVAVARALANRPKLVLADEPTGALDEANAQQVLQLILRLCTEVKASLVLVTHDMAIAGQLPRVVSLADLNHAGRLSQKAMV